MKKSSHFIVFLIALTAAVLLFATASSTTLFDSVSQYSTDELLQLRSLIDEELSQRNVSAESAPFLPTYIVNINTRKFHIPTCKSAADTKDKNKLDFYGEREVLITKEFSPCQKCRP